MTKEQFFKLSKVVALLNEADVLLQEAMGADEECYYIHTQIENASDDVCDVMRTADEEGLIA